MLTLTSQEHNAVDRQKQTSELAKSSDNQARTNFAVSKLPESFALFQNYPNPFNPETKIQYQLPVPGHVTLRIFNLLGQQVAALKNDAMPAGYHTAHWNGRGSFGKEVASGVYIYRIEITSDNGKQFVDTKRMSLMR